jgi:hypothetical protein
VPPAGSVCLFHLSAYLFYLPILHACSICRFRLPFPPTGSPPFEPAYTACLFRLFFPPALKKNYGTHVIKLDIAPVAFPLGQHLFISASNNMFYRHSQ